MPKHTPDPTLVVGLAWFDRKQWRRLTEAVEDRNEKVYVEIESLVSWCKDKGLPVNRESSAEYATQLARRRHGQV